MMAAHVRVGAVVYISAGDHTGIQALRLHTALAAERRVAVGVVLTRKAQACARSLGRARCRAFRRRASPLPRGRPWPQRTRGRVGYRRALGRAARCRFRRRAVAGRTGPRGIGGRVRSSRGGIGRSTIRRRGILAIAHASRVEAACNRCQWQCQRQCVSPSSASLRPQVLVGVTLAHGCDDNTFAPHSRRALERSTRCRHPRPAADDGQRSSVRRNTDLAPHTRWNEA